MNIAFESNYYRIETSKPMSKLMNMCNRVSFDYDLCTLLTKNNITAFNEKLKTYKTCSRNSSMKTINEDKQKCESCDCEVDNYVENTEFCQECFIEHGISCAEAWSDLD